MHHLETITVQLAAGSYPVLIGKGLLTDESCWAGRVNSEGALIVSNTTVAPLYLEQLQGVLTRLDIPHQHCLLPDGEQYKTVAVWQTIIEALLSMPANRKSTVIALGGGVVGDMAGFAAACYMRGISVIQVPTTLLAQVDAAVGGKTGVNLPAGKNLLGAFHQPALVMADINTLKTLDQREYRAGIAEVIKYGLIMDADFFDWLQHNTDDILQMDDKALHYMVATSIAHKAAIVSADALEQGKRALLNFGHTFGHALETLTDYSHWLHGEAVAIGMLLACAYGEKTGITSTDITTAVSRLLNKMAFDFSIPEKITAEKMVETMRIDKKASKAGMDLILLNDIGNAVISSGHQPEQLLKDFPIEYLG